MHDSVLRVGLIYPELLGTYGDRGNAVVLVQRARWRGHDAEIVEVAASEPIPASLDVYLFGGGEDDPQSMAAAGMRASAANVTRAQGNGAVVFAVCAGFQLIGRRYDTPEGDSIEGMALIDAVTLPVPGAPRLIGEVVVEPELDLPTVTGFENHGGRTTLGPGESPFGRVVTGGGNGDGTDGVRRERLLGTYLHGPVLPRNPALADLLLSWVLGDLVPLESELEEDLHDQQLAAGSVTGLRKWWQDRRLARG